MSLITKQNLAKESLALALQTRQSLGINLTETFDIYQIATNLGIEVRFDPIASMEAMYVIKNRVPIIILSSLRPPGRQFFNCAHELGHHILKHGGKIDQLISDRTDKRIFDPIEFSADTFGGYFLMPKSLLIQAFHLRGFHIDQCVPLEFYRIANWIGIGYSTLITHMHFGLKLISTIQLENLQKFTPRKIRKMVLGHEVDKNLVMIDSYWTSRAVDIQVSDLFVVPVGVEMEGTSVNVTDNREGLIIFEGFTPGISRLTRADNGWSVYVRVSKKNYQGRSIFRYLEDETDDNEGQDGK
ncbi:MAG: ImmA/IrrE family metallo-endopeptidase [Anaerolineaceae bacterium]|nr:ImmA/IrrE family metallo-endopeptidase [Anaerolineaceae bacterium]